MDLTVNAYRPVQRYTYKPTQRSAYKPVFKGSLSQSTIELISSAGTYKVTRNYRGLKFQYLDEPLLERVTEECLALKNGLTEHMKKYPDNVVLRMYDLGANIGASFHFEHPDLKETVSGVGAGYGYYGDKYSYKLQAMQTVSECIKTKCLPEIVNPKILDNIMEVNPHIKTDIKIRDEIAKEFAAETNLLERYEAKKQEMFASYNKRIDKLNSLLNSSDPDIASQARLNEALGLPRTYGLEQYIY